MYNRKATAPRGAKEQRGRTGGSGLVSGQWDNLPLCSLHPAHSASLPILHMLQVQSQIEFRVVLMNKRGPPICAAAKRQVLENDMASGSRGEQILPYVSYLIRWNGNDNAGVLRRASGTKTEMCLLFFCAAHRKQTYIKTWINHHSPDADLQKPKIVHLLPPQWLIHDCVPLLLKNTSLILQERCRWLLFQGHPAWLLLST